MSTQPGGRRRRSMPERLISARDALLAFGPLLLLTGALLGLAWWWLQPAPPRSVRLATGPAQSAYDAFGQAYRDRLARHGIAVQLVRSEGAADNLRLLRAGQVDLGFVQGGVDLPPDGNDAALVSLGSLFVEPLWLFVREEALRRERLPREGLTLADVARLRLNVGTPGSGVPRLMARLLDAYRIEPAALQLHTLEQTPATVAFLNGEIDALVFVSAPESLMVQMLLQTPGVRLVDFEHSEAFARRFHFLAPVVLPRGVVDLARDMPPRDQRLVASTATLLGREGTHPALLQLFTQTARELHGAAGWFQRAGSFPTAEYSEWPVASEARRALAGGTPWLQRYLPFWLANLVERMGLALGLIVAVLLPLSRVVPPLYTLRVRSRVFRWYAQLRDIEDRLEAGSADPAALRRELAALDERVAHITVPLAHADELYALRQHIALVQSRLPG